MDMCLKFQTLPLTFYYVISESVIRPGLTAQFTASKLSCLVETALQIMGVKEQTSPQAIFKQSVVTLLQKTESHTRLHLE